jgi:hypothetical protein
VTIKPVLSAPYALLGFLFLLGVGLFAFYLWMYFQEARHARRLTGRQQFLLWTLRVVVAALALLALARPGLRMTETEERLPVVAFVNDVSGSMGFPASRGNPLVAGMPRKEQTRFSASQVAVQKLQERLTRTHNCKVYTFSETAGLLKALEYRPEADIAPAPRTDIYAPSMRASGGYTNLYDAIHDVLRMEAGNKISGIVLLTDGRDTGDKDARARKSAELVRVLKKEGIPIHPVVFGTEFPLRDLRIDEVIVGAEASKGDVLKFRVNVTNQISNGLEPKLTLYEQGEPVATKTLRLRRGQNTVSIATIPDIEGLREFRLQLPTYPDEVNTKNNEAVVHVKVVKRTLRVVLIADRPSREYLYMVPALLRDPVVKLSCYLQSADVDYTHQGNANIDRLPRTVKEWENFDVAVLMDPDPNGITNQQVQGLENMVNRGGGLVIMAGRNNGLAKLIQVHATRVRGLLPVEIDKNLYPNYDKYYEKAFDTARTTLGKGHPIMFAASDEELNEQLWKTFPRFYWHHPVQGPKPKAIVLLERESGGPDGGSCLMAVQRYGEGAVCFSALDSFWRWRYPYESFDYDRLWTRIVRYLGETRLMGTQQQVALGTDRRTYSPGEQVEITLQILDPALMAQLAGEQVFVSVTSPRGDKTMVQLQPARDGRPAYQGTYGAKAVGSMLVQARQIRPEGPSDQKPLFDVKHSFRVKMQSLEDKDTSADIEGMRELAAATNGVSTTYRTIGEVDTLAEKIPTERQTLEKTVTKEVVFDWVGGVPSFVVFFALFVVLISSEWSLRKWWGLL